MLPPTDPAAATAALQLVVVGGLIASVPTLVGVIITQWQARAGLRSQREHDIARRDAEWARQDKMARIELRRTTYLSFLNAVDVLSIHSTTFDMQEAARAAGQNAAPPDSPLGRWNTAAKDVHITAQATALLGAPATVSSALALAAHITGPLLFKGTELEWGRGVYERRAAFLEAARRDIGEDPEPGVVKVP